jgi:signal transduction histidine kinase
VKYSPSGGQCEIELSRDARQAEIAVHDNGIGISEIDLPSIFERFVRADRTRSRETPGAGLGLAIARWITEVHGGTITVESQVGVGSVFRVSLPIMAEEPREIVLSELQVETPKSEKAFTLISRIP